MMNSMKKKKTLLQIAKKYPSNRVRLGITPQVVDLILAYLKNEVSAKGAAKALKTTEKHVQEKVGVIMRRAYINGLIGIRKL